MGFESSLIFHNRLLPALKVFALIDPPTDESEKSEQDLSENLGPKGEPVPGEAPPAQKDKSEPAAAPARPRCCPTVFANAQRSEVFNAGAVLLTAGLFILHCIQSLQIATNKSLFPDPEQTNGGDENRKPKEKDPNAQAYIFKKIFEEETFRRVAQITAGIFAAAFLTAAVMRARRPDTEVRTLGTLWAWRLLRLLQTGLCLVAVYSLVIHCVYYGLLAWYKDSSSPGRVGALVAHGIFSREAGSFWTAVALHSAISLWRAISRSAPPTAASPSPDVVLSDMVKASRMLFLICLPSAVLVGLIVCLQVDASSFSPPAAGPLPNLQPPILVSLPCQPRD
jgi:hypothetical protein